MRRTVTLDDDVALSLTRLRESNPGKPFKTIVNEVLRQGLGIKRDNAGKKPFKVRSYPLGLRKDLNFDKIEDVLDILEGVNRR